MIALEWRYAAGREITRTPAEVDASLDTLVGMSREDWPVLAEVTQADVADRRAAMMYVGVHGDLGALMYSGPDDRTGSYSFGAGQADGAPILYMSGGSDNEFPPNCEIPVGVVRQAVHEFAATGLRPIDVPWQSVRGGRWV
jgi:Immunity protein Imm1